jgi:hypothetical protein
MHGGLKAALGVAAGVALFFVIRGFLPASVKQYVS